MEKHYVTFYSPGTFFAEHTTREVPAWDVDAAVNLAGEIVERYGARPHSFQFSTRTRGPDDFDSKETARSNTYYLGGRIETRAEVEARNDPKEDILRANMRSNDIERLIVNDNSWRFTGEFKDGDVLLDVTLPPLKKAAG